MTRSSDAAEPALRRPLGLVLAGGGALGAWQAAALRELERAGLVFDAVLGFSAGSLNGAAYSLNVLDLAIEGWGNCESLLRFRPRLSPPALYSDEPVWRSLEYAHDDERARRDLRCRLVVSSARWQRDRLIHAEFHPNGGRWDGPLAKHLMATCAIPTIFPPVQLEHRGERHTLLDGGVPTKAGFPFTPLGDVADVIVLEMVRPDELGRREWLPHRVVDQRSRTVCRRAMDDGAAELKRAKPAARVFRLHPSRALWRMLDFSSAKAREAVALGACDARVFLARPDDYLAGVQPQPVPFLP